MSTPTLHCPICYTPHQLIIDAVVLITCDTCQHLLEREDSRLIDLGPTPPMSEAEVLMRIGSTGSLRNRPFEVISQLQYGIIDDPDSFWFEWTLLFADKTFGYLYAFEDELLYTAPSSQQVPLDAIPSYDKIELGDILEINRHKLTVVEKGEAIIMALAGQHVEREDMPEEPYFYLDLSFTGSYVANLEYRDDDCILFFGARISPDNLTID